MRPERGFALLEALVALVLIASTGVVLIQWLQQGTGTLARLDLKQRELADRDWAVAILQTQALFDQTEGEQVEQGLRLQWRVTQTSPSRANGTPGGVAGPWRVKLQTLELTLSRDDAPAQVFTVRLLAHKRAEPVALPSAF